MFVERIERIVTLYEGRNKQKWMYYTKTTLAMGPIINISVLTTLGVYQ